MNYQTTITKQSELPGYEGVSFTIKRDSEGRRIARSLATDEAVEKLTGLQGEREAFFQRVAVRVEQPLEEIMLRSLTADERETLDSLTKRVAGLEMISIKPEYFRIYFKGIEGFEIDGKAPDAEMMISLAPSDLYNEISAAIFSLLKQDEKKPEAVAA